VREAELVERLRGPSGSQDPEARRGVDGGVPALAPTFDLFLDAEASEPGGGSAGIDTTFKQHVPIVGIDVDDQGVACGGQGTARRPKLRARGRRAGRYGSSASGAPRDG
jgi:hypothetical protein